jgi:hypothetical protein
VEIPYNEIFDSMDTFIDNYDLSEFQIRYEKLVRQHKDNMIIAINISIKEGFNRLSNSIERHGGNILDIFQPFFKYLGNSWAYDI